MKLVIGILLVLAATGCQMQKWCAEHYPVVADTLYFETVRDSIVYKDTLVKVYITSETVSDTVEIPCPSPPPFFVPDTAVAFTSFAMAKAWFSYPDIILLLTQKDSILTFRFDSLITEAYYWKDKFEKVTAIQEVVRIPLLYRIALWMMVGMLFLAVVLVIVKRI